MKKLTLILFILTYALATFGVGIKEFYCCGKLKAINIAFTASAREKCAKDRDGGGCCKTTQHFFKVKDSHYATAAITGPAKFFPDLSTGIVPVNIVANAHFIFSTANCVHAPPLIHHTPVYILNCVYRI